MQTTLLGLAIAFIIALAAALIGPQFVDWNQFRPQFEAEASRVLGAVVHVNGTLDARLLPTPTLRLRAVEIGSGGAVSKLGARQLDVEFALGSLLRGEWRANELSIDGLNLDFGLDRAGRIDWPLSGASADLGSLAIDRLNLSGRVAIRDAVSGSVVTFENMVFAGDVRALAGTLRGDGKFTVAGVRSPFRVSTGQTPDGKGTRVRFMVDPGDRPLSAELDGVLSFDAMSPRFEGAVTLAHPAAAKPSDPNEGLPWRIASRVKVTASSATLEQIEVGYGPDDNALKLTGSGDIALSASPLLRASLSARQIDVDRLRGSGDGPAFENDKLTEARRLMSSLPAAPLPMRIELAADQIALGGRPIQNVSAIINGDATAWTIDNLTLLAPGATRVSLRGAVSPLGPSAAFAGPLQIDTADPAVFSNWLGEPRLNRLFGRKPARLKGDVHLAANRIALDKVEADFGGGPIEGGGSYSPGMFELALKAQDFNFDTIMDLSSSLPPRSAWPDNIHLSLEVAKATLARREFRNAGIGLTMNGNGLALERLSLGEGSDLAISGSGAIDRATTKGQLTLNANAASFGSLSGVIEPFAPLIAARLNALGIAGPVQAQLTASSAAAQAGRGDMRFNLKLDTAQANATAELKATPAFDPTRGFELNAVMNANAALDVSLSARRSDVLLSLLALDKVVSPGDGPAQLDATIEGKWESPLRGNVRVSGAAFAGEAQGNADPWAADPNASMNLTLSRANIAALFGLKPDAATALNVSGSSRLAMAGNVWKFDEIDSRVGASQVRGNAILTRGDDIGLDGQIELDQLDLASVFGVAAGTFGRAASEPLGRGMVQGWRGKIGFKAARASWPGGTEMAPFTGILSSSGQSLRLDDGKAEVGGGKADIGLEMSPSADGLSIAARAQLSNVDASALIYRNLKMPASRVSLRATLTSRGRSAGALSGALSGEGLVTLDDLRIAGLEPRVFDIASRASDTEQITDDLKLKDLVDPFMAAGLFKATSSQIPFSIQSGRLKVVMTPIEASDARAVVSGGYDIPADQADIRAALSPLKTSAKNVTPELALYLHGTPDALTRSLDVSSLSSWLALRAIDRETRRLDRIERGPSSAALPDDDDAAKDSALPKSEALPSSDVKMPKRNPRRALQPGTPSAAPGANSTSSNAQAQPLPAPIEVRPAPGVARPPPKPRPPLQLTPPSGSSF